MAQNLDKLPPRRDQPDTDPGRIAMPDLIRQPNQAA
jgi:hypothetical protein